jgi:cytochrome c oxidase subunit 2
MPASAILPSLHSTLAPAGAHAHHIDSMWRLMLWVCGVMYLLVLAFLIASLMRRQRTSEDSQRGLSKLLASWTALIAVGLFSLTLASYLTDRALAHAAPEPQVNLLVTAHQWWWNIDYVSADPSERIRTANEIHVPVNAQVQIELASHDVIHSFWVPNLNGKRDLIPGRTTAISLQPESTGVYRGFCAEFCGVQHANMNFELIVDSPQDFETWRQRQLSTATPPTNELARRGQDIFMSSACNLCHAIAGTDAAATTGPDLTHVGSRRMIASGVLPNTDENMRAWIENPQRIKPGSQMPVVSLSPADLDALVAYLRGLQ